MTRPKRPGATRRAVAFAPAHVTGFFSPDVRARDPRARGSTGAGVVLSLGVWAHAELDPRLPSSVTVSADVPGPLPISNEVARRLASRGSGALRVHLAHGAPVAQGFGMSAAGAVSTALAVAELFRIPRQHATEVAHLAELFGGGGLGGVAAIGGGGLEFRERPGVPPYGHVVHRPFARRLILGVVGGPIPSPSVLRNPAALRRIVRAADAAWSERRAPSVEEFLDASERFTDRAALAPPSLARLLAALRAEGGRAAQAMFGRSFFTVPRAARHRRAILRTLERRGIAAVEIPAARMGARTVRNDSARRARADRAATILTGRPSGPPR